MSASETDLRGLYLDLIRDVIVNDIYKDPPLKRSLSAKVLAAIGVNTRHEAGKAFDEKRRELGLDWPSLAHTMIGRKRMDNLRF